MSNNNGNKIKGKIVLDGQIECLAPMHIGSGKAEHSDMDIIRDAEGKPLIPATGFVGVLRQVIKQQTNGEIANLREYRDFWGYAENTGGKQSALCCSDLTVVENNSSEVVIRDGIRIDNKTGIVESGGKFDFELLERTTERTTTRFHLKMEFTYREKDESFVRKCVATIYNFLETGRIHLGAKTNNGFGRIGLVAEATELYLFDFSSEGSGPRKAKNTAKGDVCNWLMQDFSENSISVQDLGESFPLKSQRFSIKATLRLRNSLLVRAYIRDPKFSDASQLKSREDWVIPGSSLKGTIRARAERIVNTLELDNGEEMIAELFGTVDDKTRSKDVRKGRVRVREIILPKDSFQAEQQTRIRVDRFTGGVIEGGLFDSMPVFAPEEDKTLALLIEIDNYKNCDAGLLLLVLKDLWSGDLAVGGEKNIGRGTFQGVRAEIVWDGEEIVLEHDLSTLEEHKKKKLQSFVEAIFEEPPYVW